MKPQISLSFFQGAADKQKEILNVSVVSVYSGLYVIYSYLWALITPPSFRKHLFINQYKGFNLQSLSFCRSGNLNWRLSFRGERQMKEMKAVVWWEHEEQLALCGTKLWSVFLIRAAPHRARPRLAEEELNYSASVPCTPAIPTDPARFLPLSLPPPPPPLLPPSFLPLLWPRAQRERAGKEDQICFLFWVFFFPPKTNTFTSCVSGVFLFVSRCKCGFPFVFPPPLVTSTSTLEEKKEKKKTPPRFESVPASLCVACGGRLVNSLAASSHMAAEYHMRARTHHTSFTNNLSCSGEPPPTATFSAPSYLWGH